MQLSVLSPKRAESEHPAFQPQKARGFSEASGGGRGTPVGNRALEANSGKAHGGGGRAILRLFGAWGGRGLLAHPAGTRQKS